MANKRHQSTTAIIIVTYNAMKWIDRCLSSCGNYDVIIIDNNSDDSTVNYIRQNYSQHKIIQLNKNVGFGKANNIGLQYTYNLGYKYFFLLNQDAYLFSDTIEKLIKVQTINPEYFIISPIHLSGNKNSLDNKFTNYLVKAPNILFDLLNNNKKTLYNVPFVNAAAWLLSRNTLEKIGGFSPLYFHYGEDDDFCNRVRYHNGKIGIVTNSFIIHDRSNSIKNKNLGIIDDKEYLIKMSNINLPDNIIVSSVILLIKNYLTSSTKNIFSLRLIPFFKSTQNTIKIIKTISYIKTIRTKTKKIGMHFIAKVNKIPHY